MADSERKESRFKDELAKAEERIRHQVMELHKELEGHRADKHQLE